VVYYRQEMILGFEKQEGGGRCMNVQYKKGVLELCVLVLLNNRDHYGYELVQSISENIEISEGTVYPLLRRLTKEGYFSTYLVESQEGPPRKYYSLTDQGREYMNQLVSDWQEFASAVQVIIEKGKES